MRVEFLAKQLNKGSYGKLYKSCSASVYLENGIKLYCSFDVGEDSIYFEKLSDIPDDVEEAIKDIILEGVPFSIQLDPVSSEKAFKENNSKCNTQNNNKEHFKLAFSAFHPEEDITKAEIRNIDEINKCISSTLTAKYGREKYKCYLRFIENAYVENNNLVIITKDKISQEIFKETYMEEVEHLYRLLIDFKDIIVNCIDEFKEEMDEEY